MKELISTICIFSTFCLFGQNSLETSVLFEETFDSNVNKWRLSKTWDEEISIENGVITHSNYRSNNSILNTVEISKEVIDKGDIISFKIANLNNGKDLMYPVFSENKKGEKGKLSYVKSSIWSLVWGFKDYDNFNKISFYTNNEKTATAVVAYSYINGNEIEHFEHIDYGLISNATGFNIIRFKKMGGKYFVFVGDNIDFSDYALVGIIPSDEWLGNGIGYIVGGGGKIVLDDIKIEAENVKINSYLNIDVNELNSSLSTLSKEQTYFHVKTFIDGSRAIQYCDEEADGLYSDLNAIGLKINALAFQYLFEKYNFDRNKPYTAEQLIEGLEKLNIKKMSFKSKSFSFDYTWKEIIQSLK